jgi:aminoglycoside phosphotransferase family enzyme
MTIYCIKHQFLSPATCIILAHEKFTSRPFCFKMWLPCENGVYSTGSKRKRINFLLDGLEFNRRFAPDVYLGVMEVRYRSTKRKEIRCGPLIKEPDKRILKVSREYALLMEWLDHNWEMNNWLQESPVTIPSKLKFVAQKIAEMHRNLYTGAKARFFGAPENIKSKLEENSELFLKALNRLGSFDIETEQFFSIIPLMEQAHSEFEPLFLLRQSHIKRCHGDLKLSNLWIRPAQNYQSHELLALDCIDFKESYCYIDTLSDLAMLVIDIEVFLLSHPNLTTIWPQNILVQHFTHTYLKATEEEVHLAHTLMAYYLLEKAMVCIYMYILFEVRIDAKLCRLMLDNALAHAENLQKLLSH